ncbi:hypothetical protein QR680_004521 [Steinernema hermaphroditum]|uniref:Uncharacterized protein n=1 Tax=Steinernema hermaphroditum TaxID=289476 RepID=A0AA39HNZ0_9BILA|nr:hypothetical protein QR680_004521 [Steinernema hermaphroditum]
MNATPPEFIANSFQSCSFATVCAATKLSGDYGQLARQFHQRSFILYVYAKKPMDKRKPFSIRQAPTFNNPWNCCCKTKPEAASYGAKFPKCIEDNMKYFHSIRIIFDEVDKCEVVLKPSFLPALKKLLKEPFAKVAGEEHYHEYVPFFTDHLIRTHYQELRAADVCYEMRHLIHSAFGLDEVTEVMYRFKECDENKFIRDMLRKPDLKVYIQSSCMHAYAAIVVQTYDEWYKSKCPFQGKYMVDGGDLLKIYEEIKEDEMEQWVRLENLPVHLMPYTKDDRYPLYQEFAKKCYFMRSHPKLVERKIYLALGVYGEAQNYYQRNREKFPQRYPEEMPFSYCMAECETYFIFYE